MNTSKDYILVNLPYIKKNLKHFKKYANLAYDRFKFSYGETSSTAFYKYYNCVSLLVGSIYYYKMFKDAMCKTYFFYSTEFKNCTRVSSSGLAS